MIIIVGEADAACEIKWLFGRDNNLPIKTAHLNNLTAYAAKGFKEIKWRCVNRIQYGKRKCHCSPTIDEELLHCVIVDTINEFCDVKDEVANALRECS